MTSRLALITFLDGDGLRPDNSLPSPPPYPDNTLPPIPPGYWGGVAPPFPTHPIAPGGSPGRPSHPIVIPPGYWGGVAPPFPTHPIAPGGPGVPPGYWGGVAPPLPDNTLPGVPPQPKPPGFASQLPSFDPSNGGWVYGFIPGYGWGWSWMPNPNPARPDNSLPGSQPGVDNTLPGSQPEVNPL